MQAEATRVLGAFLRDGMRLNMQEANFRLFGPDETASNRLDAVYEVTGKAWMGETDPLDADLVVFSGNPFELQSRVLLVVCNGRVVVDHREENQ